MPSAFCFNMSSAEEETEKEGTSLLAVYDGIVFEVRGLCAYLVYELFVHMPEY